jgi:hypothetical protein
MEKAKTSAEYYSTTVDRSRSQWPRGLRRRSVAARLLRLWVRIGCCVLSGRGLCASS